MTIDKIISKRFLIGYRVVKRFVVISPRNATTGIGNFVREHLPVRKSFYFYRIKISSNGIHDDGSEFVIGTRAEKEVEERLVFTHLISISQNFFLPVKRIFLSAIDRIFPAFDK